MCLAVRLLYGKMQAKSGKDTAGHKHVQMRKNMILRFLAGSQPGEVKVFLDLVFHPFLHLVSGECCHSMLSFNVVIMLSQHIIIQCSHIVLSLHVIKLHCHIMLSHHIVI